MQKKLLLITFVLASTVLSLMAQNSSDIFYIYRNDGNFNVFFREEVDSITCSNYDSDSIFHDEIVTQLVYTHDSIYRIPLAVIDSLSFYTPPTVYKSGVINLLDGLGDYVISAVEDTITIMAATPESLLPHVGDKIVTTEMSELFPIGYAGKVINIQKQPSGYILMCCPVALEDVFEVFYGYTRTEVPVTNSRKRAIVYQRSATYQPEPFHSSLTYGLPNAVDVTLGDWAGTYNSRFDMTFAPKLWINGFIKIANDERYFSVTVTGDYSLREEFSQTGKLSWSHDFGLNNPIPIPVCPFLQVFVEPGLFVKAEFKSSCSLTFTQHYTSAFHYEWSSNGTIAMEPVFEIRRKDHTSNFKGAVSGELAFGGYLDIGIQAFRNNIASIYGRAELGLSVSGNVNMEYDEDDYTNNTRLYDMLNKSSCEANWYWGTSFEAQLTPFLHYSHGLPFGRQHNIWKHGFVPTFSNVSLKQCLSPQSSADASIDMSGDCLTPVEIGLSLRNSYNEEVADQYAQTAFEHGNYRFRNTFNNLWLINKDEDYTLYPKIRFNGIEMLASPSSDMERTEFPVKITDFTVTDSHHEKNGFYHEGNYYDYCFNVAVTVVLNNNEDIEDWGYVYKDPNGNLAHVSLANMESPFIDERYAYYRNQSPSTATFYEYVKYVDDKNYYYEDEKNYSLWSPKDVKFSVDTYATSANLKIDKQFEIKDSVSLLYSLSANPIYSGQEVLPNKVGVYKISNLIPMQTYYYCGCITRKGEKIYTDINSFKTPPMVSFGEVTYGGYINRRHKFYCSTISSTNHMTIGDGKCHISLNADTSIEYVLAGVIIGTINKEMHNSNFYPTLARNISWESSGEWGVILVDNDEIRPGIYNCYEYAELSNGQVYYGPVTTINIPRTDDSDY